MTTEPLSFEEARRRLLKRKSEPKAPRYSQSQWLNVQARKEQTKGPSSENPCRWWRAEFEEMIARGLSRKEMIEEIGLPWSTIENRLLVIYHNAAWPPL